MKPRLLDLYSCAGGAAVGYARAGFDVVGVDINPQPNYPYEHHVSDALEYLAAHGHEFDAIHASPPCQLYSSTRTLAGRHGKPDYADLLAPTRDALQDLGKPYIIENVPGAPMNAYVTLCGSEFGLRAPDVDGVMLQLRRHRQFESNVWLMGAGGCSHDPHMKTASVMGYGGAFTTEWRDRPREEGGGGKGYVPALPVLRQLMGGVDWMTKRELSESIPPAYTEFIGAQLLTQL